MLSSFACLADEHKPLLISALGLPLLILYNATLFLIFVCLSHTCRLDDIFYCKNLSYLLNEMLLLHWKSEKFEPQLGFEPTTIGDLVRWSNHSYICICLGDLLKLPMQWLAGWYCLVTKGWILFCFVLDTSWQSSSMLHQYVKEITFWGPKLAFLFLKMLFSSFSSKEETPEKKRKKRKRTPVSESSDEGSKSDR